MYATGHKLTSATTPALVKLGWRESSTGTTTTTVLGVLRLPGFSVLAGYAYLIRCKTHLVSTVAGDGIGLHIRYTTDGSTPGIGSTILKDAYDYPRIIGASLGQPAYLAAIHRPGADQTLGLLLCIVRAAGTGNVSSFADATSLTELAVYQVGPQLTNEGVAI